MYRDWEILFFLRRNGPYTIEDLGNMLETGSLLKNDLVWYEGIEDWTPLENLSLMQELQAIKNLSLGDVETNEQVSESNEVTVPQIAYGDFPDLKIYFNPTPNDRNLEFDPTKNLFKNLEPTDIFLDQE